MLEVQVLLKGCTEEELLQIYRGNQGSISHKFENKGVVGFTPNPPLQTALDGPIRLVREGLIDIEVKLGGKMPPFEVTKVNKIPDTSKKRTFLRVTVSIRVGNYVRIQYLTQ